MKENSAAEHISQALSLSKSGQFDLAITHLYEALRLEPNNTDAYNSLGTIYYRQGQIAKAIPIFEKILRINPNNWAANYNLANCCVKADMVLQAIDNYKQVIKLNPDHANAKINLAMSLVSIKNYAEALPLLIEAAAKDLDNAELQGHLAEAYLDLGKSKEAIEQYNLALKLQPARAEWQHNLAILYLRSRQYDLAKTYFTQTLTLQPDNQTAKHMLNALSAANNVAFAPKEYVISLFDQYANYYDQHMRNNLQYESPSLLRQTIGKLLGETAKQQNILDIGCGTGLCGIYFRDLARSLIGIDLSMNMLLKAKSIGAYDGLCCGDILQAIPGLGQHLFDLVLAADVLVYIGDLTTVFNLVKNTLVSAGKFAFTIEDLDRNEDYQLQISGRFAHNKNYIHKLCKEFDFVVAVEEKIILRQQDDIQINGILFVLNANLVTIV